MKLIAIDDGHGINTAGKRTPLLPNGIKSETGRDYMNENLFNRAVAKYLDVELKRNGFRTIMVAPTDDDTPLERRVSVANLAKADLYVSIHANALAGKWGTHGGIETFTYGLKGESYRIGKAIHDEVVKGTPLRNRGVKDGSHLYVVKHTKMPAVLVEYGFMDNLTEAKLLLSEAYRKECAIETAKGICKAYGVAYKAETAVVSKPVTTPQKPNTATSDTYFRVVTGSFKSKSEAEKRMAELKKSGFDSFILPYKQ